MGRTDSPARRRRLLVGCCAVGAARTYRMSVPRRSGNAPVPLIVLLHGLGSSADDVIRASDLPERARLRGMAVVTPNAYACARQDQIDAIATVSVEFEGACTKPMPYLAFHGIADPIVAYGATAGNMQHWASIGRCGDPVTTVLDAHVTRTAWARCAPGVAVVLYAITGGVHEWPGAALDFSGARDTTPRSASDTIVQFLERQHR